MAEADRLLQALRLVGGDPAQVTASDTAYVLAHGHQVLGDRSIPGVRIVAASSPEAIDVHVTIEEGHAIAHPVHLCFGLLDRYGAQRVRLELEVQSGASAVVWSHCLFTNAELASHAMEATVHVADHASLALEEAHYHGPFGGIEVLPRSTVRLDRGARLVSRFSLLHGRVGRLDLDQAVDAGSEAVVELASRVLGRATDEIRLREQVELSGAGARGLITSRVAVDDEATATVLSVMHAAAARARGHVDCREIVRGAATVTAIPEVRVSHPEAKVTHEAAIGSVDRDQLETLLARGLDPEAAVDRIVLGMLA